jgi:hypothetical protein
MRHLLFIMEKCKKVFTKNKGPQGNESVPKDLLKSILRNSPLIGVSSPAEVYF